jgi:regulator of RNase E activity RraB
MFHTATRDWIKPWAERALLESPRHRLDFKIAEDPGWSLVRWCGAEAAAADGDRRAIALLVEQGIDPKQLREIEYFLYFDDEQTARSAAAVLVDHEYRVRVNPADGRWCIVAAHEERPTPSIIARMRTMLTNFCGERGGEFDGWGVPI